MSTDNYYFLDTEIESYSRTGNINRLNAAWLLVAGDARLSASCGFPRLEVTESRHGISWEQQTRFRALMAYEASNLQPAPLADADTE